MRMSTKMFIFAAGVAVGSLSTWYSVKRYYEKVANDEIDSMKEWVANRLEEQKESFANKNDNDVEKIRPDSPSKKPDLKEYAAMVNNLGYKDYSHRNENNEDEDEEEIHEPMEDDDEDDDEDEDDELDGFFSDHIFVIKPESLGEKEDDGYRIETLTHYADGVLTDEQNNIIEDVEGTVGAGYAKFFGVYEDDAVCVRNEYDKVDYEILADLREYSSLNKNNSHPTEDE